MTIDEAIEILNNPEEWCEGEIELKHGYWEASEMAIEALETIEKGVVPVDWHNDVYETIQKRYIDLLERTRWIPVSERLPDVDTVVIGYDMLWNDVCPVIYQDRVYNQMWHKIRSGKDLHRDRITHWMPLPKPPQEVE